MVEEEAEAEELPGTSGAKRTDLDGLTACGSGAEEEAEAELLVGIEKESCRVGEGERAMTGPMTAGGFVSGPRRGAAYVVS